jgi:hypothetical protein
LTESATATGISISPWKRLAVRSLLGGAACGVVLALILIAFFLYQERPKPWDSRALRTVHAKAEPIDQLDATFKTVGTGIFFTVDVENTTGMDISLPQTLTVMGKTRDSHALHGSFLKLNRDYFIPAKHIETISLDADQLCAADTEPQKCFDSYFRDDEEIIVFDNQNRYELRISMPSLSLPPDGTKRLGFPK